MMLAHSAQEAARLAATCSVGASSPLNLLLKRITMASVLRFLALAALALASEDEDPSFSAAVTNSEDATGSDDIGAQTPSSVYVP